MLSRLCAPLSAVYNTRSRRLVLSRLECCLLAHAQIDSPTHTEVDEVHARVVAAVQQLYRQHRHLLPQLEARDLEVV